MTQMMEDIMSLCCKMAEDQKMTVMFKGAVKGAVVTGGSTLAGALLLGPRGILAGAAVGGLVAWMTSDKFKPLPQILMELPDEEKEKLCFSVREALGSLQWTDVYQLIRKVQQNKSLKHGIERLIENYVTKNLGAELKYGD